MGIYEKRGYLNSDFRIFHLTDQLAKEYEFHYHEFHKITIFIRGNVQYYIEGKTYALEPYDIVLVEKNDLHRIQVDGSMPYERIIVYISPGFMADYKNEEYDLNFCFQKAKEEHSHVLRIPSLEKSSLFKITNRLERSFDDTEYAGSLYRQLLFLEFMIQLNRAALKKRIEFLDTERYNSKVISILNYINAHLTEALDIDSLADTFFISKYYMMRLFKAETGYTIGSYITYRRLLLARNLIEEGAPITEACFAAGFRDYSTFSRSYKAEFKEPPRNLLSKSKHPQQADGASSRIHSGVTEAARI